VTPAQLKVWQQKHYNHLGEPLKADGVLGPQTQWALEVSKLSSLRRLSIGLGLMFVDFGEDPDGSNDDPQGLIRGLLARCSVAPALAWCAAFLSFLIGKHNTASALSFRTLYPVVQEPIAGDVFCYPTNDKGNGHCGLVIGVDRASAMTLEGNAGNRVRVHLRPRAGLTFSRPFGDTGTGRPGVLNAPEAGTATR